MRADPYNARIARLLNRNKYVADRLIRPSPLRYGGVRLYDEKRTLPPPPRGGVVWGFHLQTHSDLFHMHTLSTSIY